MRPFRAGTVGAAFLVATSAAVVAVLTSRAADWRTPGVIALMLVLGAAADRYQFRSPSGALLAATHPAWILTAVLFGPAPAAAIAVLVSLAQPPKRWVYVLGDVAVYATFPLVAGLIARGMSESWGIGRGSGWFMVVVAVVFVVTWLLNHLMVDLYMKGLDPKSDRRVGAAIKPLLSTQLALALGTAVLAFFYMRVGPAVLVLAAVLLFTYNRLTRDLAQAQHNAEEAERNAGLARDRATALVRANSQLLLANEQLIRAHLGAIRAMVHGVHAHDRMTARHSAAVARFARSIAKAVGCTEEEQRLVHTAGLLHDVGKHIFDDAILKGGSKLTDEQWEIVKRHPEEGARIVRLLEGHEAVAEIILAHHERIDGRGYPFGLAGEQVPRLARMISIADTYDVMTARDSYQDPVAPREAVAELRRVAGTQLDADLVEVFIEHVLAREGVAFGHADDADFEAELDFERRVREMRRQAWDFEQFEIGDDGDVREAA